MATGKFRLIGSRRQLRELCAMIEVALNRTPRGKRADYDFGYCLTVLAKDDDDGPKAELLA
jgi:hypothetical protein